MQIVVGDAGRMQTRQRALQLVEDFLADALDAGGEGVTGNVFHAQHQPAEGAEQRRGMLPALQSAEDFGFVAYQQACDRGKRGSLIAAIVLDHSRAAFKLNAINIRFEQAFAALEHLIGGNERRIAVESGQCVHENLPDAAGAESVVKCRSCNTRKGVGSGANYKTERCGNC
ncbi:hypothetical protein D3C81_892980 [compost metagenome]